MRPAYCSCFSLLVVLIRASSIYPGCLQKSPSIGTPSGTEFSDATVLTSEVDPKLHLYGYYECNNQNGNLQAMQSVLADNNNANRKRLNLVGTLPEGQSSCPGFTFPSSYIYRAAIVAEEGRIVGVRFQSTAGITDIGRIAT